jgi:hypothetical protein
MTSPEKTFPNFPIPSDNCEIVDGSMLLVLEIPGIPDPQTIYLQSLSGSIAYDHEGIALRELHGNGRSQTYTVDFACAGQAGVYSETKMTRREAGMTFGSVSKKLKT